MKLIKFQADWCMPCQRQKEEFKINPIKNVELIEIDIDDDIDNLSAKYKVMSIPTLILIDDNDNLINKWIGFTKSEIINDYIKNL